MRSDVPRTFPVVHSIGAIHHLAQGLWLLRAWKRPIHQLRHPYNETSPPPLQAAASFFLAVITVFPHTGSATVAGLTGRFLPASKAT